SSNCSASVSSVSAVLSREPSSTKMISNVVRQSISAARNRWHSSTSTSASLYKGTTTLMSESETGGRVVGVKALVIQNSHRPMVSLGCHWLCQWFKRATSKVSRHWRSQWHPNSKL